MNHLDEHSGTQSMLRAYFRDLDAALSGLPRNRRNQLADEIRQHVDQALTQQPPQSPAELQNLLDRVGRPEDIAAAALEEEPGQPRPPMRTGRKILITGVSVLVLAGLGTGLAFAWPSPRASNGSPAAVTTPATHSAATPPPTVIPTTVAPTTVASSTPAAAAQPGTAPGATPSAQPSTSAGAGTSAVRTILAPATVPPVSNECTLQLTYDADGNVSPLTCPGGGVNTLAWHHYAYGLTGTTPNNSKLLRLGPYASPAQVYQAMCYDYHNVYGTPPLTEHAEQLAQAYYGWQFAGDNPLRDFGQLGCPKG